MTSEQLVKEFYGMLGWRYEWGAAREGCVDCSGAFVHAMRKHGMEIYHGSNTIWRKFLDVKGRIRELPLLPGVAVFKWREDGEPQQYEEDGEDDFYHIGLYVGDGNVIEAKSVKAGCVMSTLEDGWTHAGYLRGIEYCEEDAPDEVNEVRKAVICAESGSTVNVRREPNGERIGRIPLCTVADVFSSEGGWSSISSTDENGQPLAGYVKTEFLAFEEQTPPDMISLSRKKLSGIYNDLGRLLGVYG